MSASINWRIPSWTLHHLERAPKNRAVVLLLRHSVRDALPPGKAAYVLPITEIGKKLATDLGGLLRGRLKKLYSSPLSRCVQTAECLRDGAESALPVVTDRLLGDPGAFVLDGDRAWSNWKTRGHEGVMEHLVSCPGALPGMARPDEAARFLVHHMLTIAGRDPGVHIFVTHDSLVTATAARLLGNTLSTEDWPHYLGGALFWRDERGLHTAYREHTSLRAPAPLCSLSETDAVEFARREIAATIGLGCPARFFLAGGAFRTLLTGRPPRDLDVWAPSPSDRNAVLRALQDRGAHPLDGRPYADAFAIGGRVVEIPHRVAPPTLAGRLARFDLALSAVGVEHDSNDRWSATVHPLARESARRRQVLLLKPLANWKYALATLARMRRYADDLGFTSPPEEEAEIWRVFDAQPPAMQRGMIERFHRTAVGQWGVADDIKRRRP